MQLPSRHSSSSEPELDLASYLDSVRARFRRIVLVMNTFGQDAPHSARRLLPMRTEESVGCKLTELETSVIDLFLTSENLNSLTPAVAPLKSYQNVEDVRG